jgi:hypothetical protein
MDGSLVFSARFEDDFAAKVDEPTRRVIQPPRRGSTIGRGWWSRVAEPTRDLDVYESTGS